MNTNIDELIRAFLENANDLNSIVRELNKYDGYLDDLIWEDMKFLSTALADLSHSEILNLTHNANFNPNHSYWRYDQGGGLESSDSPEFNSADIDLIMQEIDCTPYQYLPEGIQKIINNCKN